MDLTNKMIYVPSVRLYRDSYGTGPGQIIKAGIYQCYKHVHDPGRVAPISIKDLGWVKCYYTGQMYLSFPGIYKCDSDEKFENL